MGLIFRTLLIANLHQPLPAFSYPEKQIGHCCNVNQLPNQFPTRVSKFQRIVNAITIPVKTLAKIVSLYIVVRAQEPTQNRIIHPSVHVNQTKFRQMLMSGVAPVKSDGVQRNSLFSPGIVTGLKGCCSFAVGQRDDTAQVIGMGIIDFIRQASLFKVNSRQAIACANVIKLTGYPVVNELSNKYVTELGKFKISCSKIEIS